MGSRWGRTHDVPTASAGGLEADPPGTHAPTPVPNETKVRLEAYSRVQEVPD